MIPKFILNELDHWINTESFGELKIIFQKGRIQRWVRTKSSLPPKSSESLQNSGQKQQDSQVPKLEVTK